MAFRVHKSLVKGEVDNRQEGLVRGKLWFLGQARPIVLRLEGNARQDIAGTRIRFENPRPEPDPGSSKLRTSQAGKLGELTASRKVKVLGCSLDQAREQRESGEDVPTKLANSLYFEWFSEANGRVVIESADFIIYSDDDEPAWKMTGDEDSLQSERNRLVIRDYIRSKDAELGEQYDESDDDDFSPMDEFEWEKALRESDARSDKYGDLLDKYWDHPDRDRVIAREMGWEWLDDALDADERGAFEEEKAQDTDHAPEFEPDPETEGVDWIRTDSNSIRHPLAHRAFDHTMWIWHYCEDRGLLGDEAPEAIHKMVFEAQTLSAKLAGALNSLCYRAIPDGGFVVACLKRALKFLERSLAASEKVVDQELLDVETMQTFRAGLFEIRESMIDLMKHYRSADTSF